MFLALQSSREKISTQLFLGSQYKGSWWRIVFVHLKLEGLIPELNVYLRLS